MAGGHFFSIILPVCYPGVHLVLVDSEHFLHVFLAGPYFLFYLVSVGLSLGLY
jgi:hypothetical protein